MTSDRDIVALFQGLDTPAVSDALDKLQINGQCLGISALANYAEPVAGIAFTVKYVPAGSPPGTIGDFQDEVPPGAIVVIDNQGRTDCTVWGDILTQWAVARGFGGTVIDGVCRDTLRALDDGYPMFTRGRYMRTGKDRVELAGTGVPVSIGGVRVRAGDLVVGDANGIVIVPREHAAAVAELARHISQIESQIRLEIEAGKTLGQARQALGYHVLQRKLA
jgi:regulator of RNase E activity RraA